MPSTYLSLNVHLVFSTKNRQPLFNADVIERAHEYLGGSLRGLGASPIKIGGVADHVHILAGVKGNHCISGLVREVKKSSTKWMREEMRISRFSWQEGYAAFSVSPERLSGVSKYIENQAQHHRTSSFKEELEELFKLAGIPFDRESFG